jgi:hypothetical protein
MPNIQQLYQDALAYAGCMRSHGHPNFPAPEMVNNARTQEIGIGQGVDLTGPQYRSANKICKSLLPNSGGGPSQTQVQQQLAKDLKFSKCMRSHGLPTFPDPKASSSGLSIGPAPGIDINSPKFQAAQKACRSLMPFP